MNIQYKLCSWELYQQQLMTVRHKVFIEEQHVPIELEIDEHDDNSLHILALDDDQPIATARLLNDGHIGRMCVLKDYRLNGIASEMLHRLVQAAQEQNHKTLLLNAQITAIPFYEKAGFKICSDTFLDAGIEHKSMQLKLPQAILGDNTLTIELDSKSLCQEMIVSLISQATQNIAIFSQHLEIPLYHQNEVCRAIKSLVSRNKKANIRIICKDSRSAAQHGHCLINLAQNLSSFIEIRKPNTKEIQQFQQSWLLIDDLAYCHIKNIDRFMGTASFNQKLIVKESLNFFNHAWDNSEVDQLTRRLSL